MAVEYIRAVYALPKKVDGTRVMNSTEVCILAYLANCANELGECWPKQQTIADACGLDIDTVKGVLLRLANKGLISKQRRMIGGRTVSSDIKLAFEPIKHPDRPGRYTPVEGGVITPVGPPIKTPVGGGIKTPIDRGGKPLWSDEEDPVSTPHQGGPAPRGVPGRKTPDKNHHIGTTIEPKKREKESPLIPQGGDCSDQVFSKSKGPASQLVSLVDQVWSLTPKPSRLRSGRGDLQKALSACLGRGHTPKAIIAGLSAYFASDQATKNGGEFVKGVHRMVEQDRWREFVSALAQAPAQPLLDLAQVQEEAPKPKYGPLFGSSYEPYPDGTFGGVGATPYETAEERARREVGTPSAPGWRVQEFRMRQWAQTWPPNRKSVWKPDWGPMPGEPGCWIDPRILAKFADDPQIDPLSGHCWERLDADRAAKGLEPALRPQNGERGVYYARAH